MPNNFPSPKKNDYWVPHKGPYKLIKLPPNAGLTPPMTEIDGKHIVRTNVHRDGWNDNI